MKLVAVAIALAVLPARQADAVAVCRGEHGWAPATGTPVPPHARLLWYSDGYAKDITAPKVIAKLDGKPVKTTVTRLAHAQPYTAFLVEIESAATGALELDLEGIHARYDVREDARHPDEVHATQQGFFADIRYTAIPERYDGVALELDAPAVVAHVKVRRDAKAGWKTFDVPVMAEPEPLGGHEPYFVPIGKLGCTENYPPDDLVAASVEFAATVTFADGHTLPVTGLR